MIQQDARRPLELGATARTTLIVFAAIGAITAAAGAVMSPERMWASWLLVAFCMLGFGLGGLCFVAMEYTTGAHWSVAIRRVPEAMAGTLPLSAALLAILFIVRPQFYAWTASGAIGSGSVLAFKQLWLSRPFFLVRAAVYFAIWIAFASAIRRRSLLQDRDGDHRWSRSNYHLSAAFLVLFGISVSLASFDWLMSIEFRWYSTIYGVYNFAGIFLSGLAAIILIVLWLERAGPLRGIVNESHLHDLGKLLFAFSIFWMYIWFSEYMLIWYTDFPEETSHFVARVHGAWLVLFLANIFLNWVIPFCVLLRRDTKRQRQTLGWVAAIVLVGRWIDVYLLIFPGIVGASPRIGLWEIGLTLGGIGAFGLLLVRNLRSAPSIPIADPQLVDSLQYQH
jgi:hypothetical protein